MPWNRNATWKLYNCAAWTNTFWKWKRDQNVFFLDLLLKNESYQTAFSAFLDKFGLFENDLLNPYFSDYSFVFLKASFAIGAKRYHKALSLTGEYFRLSKSNFDFSDSSEVLLRIDALLIVSVCFLFIGHFKRSLYCAFEALELCYVFGYNLALLLISKLDEVSLCCYY